MCRRLAVSPNGGLVPGFTLLCPWIFGQIAVEDPYILLHMHQRIPRAHQPCITWRKVLSCNWLWCMSNRIKESCFKEAPYQKNLLHNMLEARKIKERVTIWNAEPKPDTQVVLTHRSLRSTVLTRWLGHQACRRPPRREPSKTFGAEPVAASTDEFTKQATSPEMRMVAP